MAKLGDAITKKLSTGRLYLKRKGENNYADFGNVTEHKPDPQVGRAEHMKSDGGFKQTDFSLVKSINPKYVVQPGRAYARAFEADGARHAGGRHCPSRRGGGG
jgi:hypothetical protein